MVVEFQVFEARLADHGKLLLFDSVFERLGDQGLNDFIADVTSEMRSD